MRLKTGVKLGTPVLADDGRSNGASTESNPPPPNVPSPLPPPNIHDDGTGLARAFLRRGRAPQCEAAERNPMKRLKARRADQELAKCRNKRKIEELITIVERGDPELVEFWRIESDDEDESKAAPRSEKEEHCTKRRRARGEIVAAGKPPDTSTQTGVDHGGGVWGYLFPEEPSHHQTQSVLVRRVGHDDGGSGAPLFCHASLPA